MFGKYTSSSHCVSFVRPTLEVLEDRTVPSPFGDLLNEFGTNALSNIATGEVLVAKLRVDAAIFDFAPSVNNLVPLAIDTFHLQSISAQVSQQAAILNVGVGLAKSSGQVSGFEADALHGVAASAIAVAKQLHAASDQALGDLIAAFFAVGSGSAHLTPLPFVGASIDSFQPPPASVPSSAGTVTATATISGGTNTLVQLSVSGDDGFSKSTSQIINDTGSVSLTIPTGGPGVVDTFTLTVEGVPQQQTATTHYT